MARKLKPVAETPISDPASLKRIDPFWRHRRVPEGFWDDRQNRRDYLLSSAKTFRLRVMHDLYRLDLKQCYKRNRGSRLADHWDYLPYKAVQDIFPQYDWKPWLFKAVSKEFWKVRANRRSYLDWLGKQLGFRRPQDWYRIRISDIAARHGRGLLNQVPLPALMRSYLPQLDWDRVYKHRRLSVKQILQWADEYFDAHGKWPITSSGPIGISGETWATVGRALEKGRRGLRGKSSLTRLLAERRGMRNHKRLPPLSENQILAWADAYYSRHGTWPIIGAGPVAALRKPGAPSAPL